MFSKFKILAAGAALALVSTQASAVTYSSGENAAGTSVVTATVSQTVSTANVNNVSAHLSAITSSISGALSAPVPITPAAPVAPAPAPVGGPAPAPSGGGNAPSATPAPGGDQTSFKSGDTKRTVTLFDSASQKGYGAGNEMRKTSVWGNLSYTWMESDVIGANFDGTVAALNVGIDKWFTDKAMAGVSVGYSKTDVTTTFNSGEYEEASITVAPYGLVRLTDNVNFAGLIGHTWGDVDQNRQNGATTASTDASTWFAAGTLSVSKQIKKLGLVGSVGYLWSSRDTDGFTESDANVVEATTARTSQGRIGGEASYFIGGTGKVNLTPFASADYIRDFKDEINDDADAFDLGLGLRVGSKDGSVSGTVKVNTQVGRSDFESTTASATLRLAF